MSVAQGSRKLAPLADRKAREYLRQVDPALGRVIDAHPGFRPRAWLDDLPPGDAFGTLTALTEVPGIGPWSAHGFLLVALDRPDVYLTGDIALRRAIQGVFGFDHVPTEEELAELSDRWRPYRSLVVSYLFAAEYDDS